MTVSITNQISPANERLYHQSNLLGDWKGAWSKNHRPVELKVDNIRGDTAQVEYTHDGHTERDLAKVSGGTITYGNVTIGTRNGQQAALEFSYGPAKMSATMNKVASTNDQNELVGTWISGKGGQAVTFKVSSIDGRNAEVRYTVNGRTMQGVGDVYKNSITFGKAQITSDDGKTAKVLFPLNQGTFSQTVTKYTPQSSPSVNILA